MPQALGFLGGLFSIGAAPALGSAAFGAWAVGAGLSTTFLGSVAVRLAISVAASALSAALAPRPTAAGLRTTSTLSGGVVPEASVLGLSATGGVFVCPPMSHGSRNIYLTYVVELSGLPGCTLDGLILNGEQVAIGADETAPATAIYGKRLGGKYAGYGWVRYHDGTQTTADAMLLAKYPAPFVRPWTADMVGTGICYAVLTFAYNRAVYQSWPQCRFVLGGVPLYDPRRDTTAGGSGAHRWETPSTWEQTQNLGTILYNVLRGIEFPGGEVWGGGVDPSRLPLAVWGQEMDLADDAVDDGDGGTEAQYRAGMEFGVDDEPFGVVENLLRGAGGALAESAGVWTPRLGPPRLPVAAITDADILMGETESFAPFPSPDQVFNAAAATFPSPAMLWEPTESPLVTNDDWEARDGERRVANLSLPATPFDGQVQRLVAALIADHRRFAVHVLTLNPRFAALEALDTLAWTSAENGYTAKLFEVREAVRDPRRQVVRVTLREVDPDDFDPIVPVLPDPVDPGTTPREPGEIASGDWTLTASSVTSGGAELRPALLVEWSLAALGDLTTLEFEVQDALTLDPVTSGVATVSAGSLTITTGIAALTAYRVRLLPVLVTGAEWSDWKTVTTADFGESEPGEYLCAAPDTWFVALESQTGVVALGSVWQATVALRHRTVSDTFVSGAYTYDIDWIPEFSLSWAIRDEPAGAWIEAGTFGAEVIAASADWGLVVGAQPVAGDFADVRFRVSVRVAQTITPPGGAPAADPGDVPDPLAAHRDLTLTLTRIT